MQHLQSCNDERSLKFSVQFSYFIHFSRSLCANLVYCDRMTCIRFDLVSMNQAKKNAKRTPHFGKRYVTVHRQTKRNYTHNKWTNTLYSFCAHNSYTMALGAEWKPNENQQSHKRQSNKFTFTLTIIQRRFPSHRCIHIFMCAIIGFNTRGETAKRNVTTRKTCVQDSSSPSFPLKTTNSMLKRCMNYCRCFCCWCCFLARIWIFLIQY